jgi:pimeloyl-ACP methyl ester carboxylesterase
MKASFLTMSKSKFNSESKTLDEKERASAPSSFIALSDGTVHYELAGNGRRTVVLVCGFSVPSYIWDPTFDALTDAGFRVLRYDLYGRGFSDRPKATYDEELFDRQLFELLEALKIDNPSDLIGLSMGGPIALVFADRHPGLVRKLVLIDPAGMPQERPPILKFLQLPLIGEWLMNRYGDRMLLAGLTDDFYEPQRFPDYAEKYKAQMEYKGFRQAILSTMKSRLLTGMRGVYERVGEQEKSVLLIWGEEDRTVPFSISEEVRKAIPHAEFNAIPKAGHIPHYEKPEVVNPLLISFLKR